MVSIFLTNLGKYNEGELVGEWVELPVDDNFEQAFKDIGIGPEYEEYFITDYEAPFKIGEYDNIFDLNKKVQEMEQFTEDEDVIEAIINHCSDLDEAMEVLKSGDFIVHYCGDYDGALAEELVDEYGIDAFISPEYYFDYEGFGSALYSDGYFDNLIYDYRSQGDDEYADELEEQFENMSYTEMADYYIDGLGSLSELGEQTLSMFMDYKSLEDNILLDGDFEPFNGGYIEFVW